jgi:hypothetical protein
MTYYVDYKNGKDSFKGTEPTSHAFNVLYIAWISPGVGLLSGAILLCNPYYVDGEKR